MKNNLEKQCNYVNYWKAYFETKIKYLQIYKIKKWCCEMNWFSILQSHSFIARGNRRLSLAALPGLPAASRGVKLPLLVNTRSVF